MDKTSAATPCPSLPHDKLKHNFWPARGTGRDCSKIDFKKKQENFQSDALIDVPLGLMIETFSLVRACGQVGKLQQDSTRLTLMLLVSSRFHSKKNWVPSLTLTAKAPENGWEDKNVLLRGFCCSCLGRVW